MFAQPLVLFGSEGTAAGFTVPDMVTDTAEVSVTLLLVDGLHELRESITVYLTREAARPNTPPVVAFESATVNRLAGEPITLSATAEDAEDDCTFTWTFLQNPAADMPASVSPVVTETGYKWQVSGNHPGLAQGAYQFRLTATENRTGGASSAATVLVHVSSAAPTIGSVSPANMWPGGEVTITGTGFFGNVQVFFNGVAGIVQVIDWNTLIVRVPGFAPGPVEITVTTSGGSANAPAGSLAIVRVPVPTLSEWGLLLMLSGLLLIAVMRLRCRQNRSL